MYVKMCRMRRTQEEAARTRGEILEAGVAYFASHGYGDASLEAVARQVGVTRGAIYHHFGSKRGYFAAVLEDVLGRLRDRIEASALTAAAGPEGLYAGCDVFLEAATDRAFRQIALVDAPAVLGWDAWKDIDDRTTARSLREGLASLAGQGTLGTHDSDALAAALSGAMNELSLWIAAQDDPRDALRRARAILHGLLDGYVAGRRVRTAGRDPVG